MHTKFSVLFLFLAFLLFNLSPVAAQTLAAADNAQRISTNAPKICLRGITGEFYTLKSGEVCEVWQHWDGRKYILRANGRKYFPKRLNK